MMLIISCNSGNQILQGWVSYSGKTFSIQYPQGWSPEENENGQIMIAVEDGSSRILLWPVYVNRKLNDSDCQFLLKQFANQQSTGIKWNKPIKTGDMLFKIKGSSENKTIVALMAGNADEKGTGGFLFLTESPSDKYVSLEETFAFSPVFVTKKNPARKKVRRRSRRYNT